MTRAIPGLLAGRKVLVTGGANGIGAAVTRRFELMRAQVVVLDRPDARPANATVRAVSADVRDEGQLSSAVTEAVALLGGLDTVIAAAGVVPAWQAITALDLDEFDRVMAINARGVAATIKHTAPHLGVGSTITAVASINAWQAAATMTSYVASKHAVLGVVRAAALALGPAGVRVNAVAPGPVATSALLSRMAAREPVSGQSVEQALVAAGAVTALGRLASVEEVADCLAFLSSELSSGITGQMINVDAGVP